MRNTNKPTGEVLTASITACLDNGERLLNDAQWLEFQKSLATKLMLSMIAQEEFAKAFLLFLVREEVLPWSKYIHRAMRDHACKQLVGLLIEFLDPPWETIDDLNRQIAEEIALGDELPRRIASAILILRHEKIGKWEGRKPVSVEFEAFADHVGRGVRDQIKQDALYVRLGMDGAVVSTPAEVTDTIAEAEYNRANQYKSFVCYRSYVSLDGRSMSYVRLIMPMSVDGVRVSGFFKTIEPDTLQSEPIVSSP